MRQQFLEAVGKFEPYTALYQLCADPATVKEAIIRVLRPYVKDQNDLAQYAVSALAGEAVAVARLSSSPAWTNILNKCFAMREAAIAADPIRAFGVAGYFEHAVVEAQKSFALLVSFEVSKDDLSLEEFAFELLRTLGTLIESNVQVYLKELLCLVAVASGLPADLEAVSRADFGQVCERIEKALGDSKLLTPPPWGIRINQWRNIAQHHSFSCEKDMVLVRYGKGQYEKEARLSRADLLELARDVVWRLGALKTSRALTHFNYIDQLSAYLPTPKPHPYNDATALAASFATQGFRLTKLDVTDVDVDAVIEDAAPDESLVRPIHCSQFVASIAEHFPARAVRVRYLVGGTHKWTFSAAQDALASVMALEDPLQGLAHIVEFKHEQ